jgi:hypothetical protein
MTKEPRSFSVDPQAYKAFKTTFGKKSSACLNALMLNAVKGDPRAVEIVVGMYDEEIRRIQEERDAFIVSSKVVIEQKQDDRAEVARTILRDRMSTWFIGDGHVPNDLSTLCGWVKQKSGLDMGAVKTLIRSYAKELTSESVWLDYVDDRLMGVSE